MEIEEDVTAELEARFGRFDAERKAARDQLQTRFVRWGLGLFAPACFCN